LPDLFRHTRRTKGHPAGWLAFAALFGLCLALTRLQDRLPPGPAALSGHWSIWLLAGAGIGLGSIVPGASATFLLIYFGVYQPLLEGVARLNLPVLLPAVLGAGAAILLFARFADWLFRVAEGAATRGVLGLVAGSLWLVFPGWPHGVSAWLCGSLFVLGAGISAALNQLAPPPAEGNPS
jgi:uncharacterized membrane protein